MNWYDDLSEDLVEQLKTNCVAFGLLPEHTRKLFGPIDYTLIQFYAASSWHQMCGHETFNPSYAYRLNPDWQRPTQAKGHWEYCDVIRITSDAKVVHKLGIYRDRMFFYLHDCFSMVGFGGIEFEGEEGKFFYEYGLEKDGKPVAPKRVRFLKAGAGGSDDADRLGDNCTT